MAGTLTEIASTINGAESTVDLTVPVGPTGPNIGVVTDNPLRYSLIVSCAFTGTASLSTDPNAGPNQGIPLAAGQTIVIDVRNWGNLSQKAWFAQQLSGAAFLTVFQVLFNKDV